YFYIPGTETCLRVGGYVRYDATLGNDNSIDGTTTTDRLDGSLNNTWHKNARFELKTWTGQETELGTLKTYTESRFEFGNSNGFSASAGNKSAKLVYAWMQLGGLRVGLDDSLYAS
ncbi:MAG: porin, partial [Mesorhizobium sp.]|uniref:porin n=1 Tax=Mesorhizobium sp. TaxID=1871066 RepID=UPI000FE96C32